MNPKVDTFLLEGCGRCSLYQTPQCKVHKWSEELKQLRRIALGSGLEEDYKWSQPCYTFKGKNVFIVTSFKDHATVAFFKGSLLKDEKKLLTSPGSNSQATRQMRFTNVDDIIKHEADIKAYMFEAIEAEKAGLKVAFKKEPETIPDELREFFENNSDLKKAFETLTPGRQREYLLHFSQAKQSKTRTSRIEKSIPKILKGEGLHDHYKSNC